MVFSLPELKYSKNALEPFISEKTIEFHYGKHHQTYVNNLNQLVQGLELETKSLEEIINISFKNPSMAGIFNNAAQVWNHTFFWNSMKPNGGGLPEGKIKDLIIKNFSSYESFCAEFKQAALTQFGSGWAWLVQEGDSLKITKTSNADLPMVYGQKALLNCDVWEHAYYIDYQNRRADFVQSFIDNLIDWDFVNSNL